MKQILTHINPDLDAVCSCWLIRRFLPDWDQVEIGFVKSGKVKKVDDAPDVLYVDTGWGKLDHHQTSEYLSAAKLVLDFILKKTKGREPACRQAGLSDLEKEALEKLVGIVTEIDNARDISWPEVKEFRYYFYLHSLIDGLRGLAFSDERVMKIGFSLLDSALLNFKSTIRAKEELGEGTVFESPWGKSLAIKTANRHLLWVAEVEGYVVVIIKDPKTGAVRIYARPDFQVDLSSLADQIKKVDKTGDWFLHASKKLLLNQSSTNPGMEPTSLSLKQLISFLIHPEGA